MYHSLLHLLPIHWRGGPVSTKTDRTAYQVVWCLLFLLPTFPLCFPGFSDPRDTNCFLQWLIWRDPCGDTGLLERIREWVLPASSVAGGWVWACLLSSVEQQFKNCIFKDTTAFSHLVDVTHTVQKKEREGELLAVRQDGSTNPVSLENQTERCFFYVYFLYGLVS